MGLWRWLGYETDVLTSSLPIVACISRLRGVVQSEWALFGKSPVVGRVGESSFKLRKRLSGGAYNSFQTYVSGRLTGDGVLTRLTCRFGMHWFVTLFTTLWLTPFLAILTFSIADDLANLRAPAFDDYFVFSVFALFGIGLLCIGRYMARNEKRYLLNFLRETIDARERNVDRAAAIEDLWRNG